jgi:S-phase kinase-associated protein 1
MINLISNSNNNCKVDKNVISTVSLLIKDALEESDNNNIDEDIPLPFEHDVIEKTVEYCNYFYYVPNIYEDDLEDVKTVSSWYTSFMDVNDEMVFKLLRISDFMFIESLLELCSVKIAAIIKNKTLSELNERFNTDSYHTREELEEFESSCNWEFKV